VIERVMAEARVPLRGDRHRHELGRGALMEGTMLRPCRFGDLSRSARESESRDDIVSWVLRAGRWSRSASRRKQRWWTRHVVRIWDERRLIVPSNFFLEEIFQNWTRHGSELLGTVFLHLDPLAEIGPIRAAFEHMVEASPLWDGRARSLLVTETSQSAIEVRMLVSAANSGDAFDLRCAVREGMLEWIRLNQPTAIARQRVDAPEASGIDMEKAPDLPLDSGS
jgi:hypothetical protein